MKTLFLAILFPIAVFAQSPKIFTADIDHFWEAYDSLKNSKDSIGTIQRLYIDRATPGLKEFIRLRKFKASQHVSLIRRYPLFWQSIRKNTERIKDRQAEMEKAFQQMKVLYPPFQAPDIYFAIGTLSSGGTTKGNRVFIGAELSCADSTTNTTRMGRWLKAVLANNGDIVTMTIHEATHTQQKNSLGYVRGMIFHRVLAQSLREGAADFVSGHLQGKTLNKVQYKYGRQHEAALWTAFKKQMWKHDWSAWLYNGGTVKDSPGDLGYFMGAQICNSYYQKSSNKTKALKEIIEMKNPKRILRQSGYGD